VFLRFQRARQAAGGAVASVYSRLCRLGTMVGTPPARWQTPYSTPSP